LLNSPSTAFEILRCPGRTKIDQLHLQKLLANIDRKLSAGNKFTFARAKASIAVRRMQDWAFRPGNGQV
jgi:hypothetical protein